MPKKFGYDVFNRIISLQILENLNIKETWERLKSEGVDISYNSVRLMSRDELWKHFSEQINKEKVADYFLDSYTKVAERIDKNVTELEELVETLKASGGKYKDQTLVQAIRELREHSELALKKLELLKSSGILDAESRKVDLIALSEYFDGEFRHLVEEEKVEVIDEHLKKLFPKKKKKVVAVE